MGYNTYFKLTYILPESDGAFLQLLDDLKIQVPESVVITESVSNLETRIHEELDTFAAYGEEDLLGGNIFWYFE